MKGSIQRWMKYFHKYDHLKKVRSVNADFLKLQNLGTETRNLDVGEEPEECDDDAYNELQNVTTQLAGEQLRDEVSRHLAAHTVLGGFCDDMCPDVRVE